MFAGDEGGRAGRGGAPSGRPGAYSGQVDGIGSFRSTPKELRPVGLAVTDRQEPAGVRWQGRRNEPEPVGF